VGDHPQLNSDRDEIAKSRACRELAAFFVLTFSITVGIGAAHCQLALLRGSFRADSVAGFIPHAMNNPGFYCSPA
jgi:hypothetical protein